MTDPPVPGAGDCTAMLVLAALAGTHGWKIISVMPMPLAAGAVQWVKFIVEVMTPVNTTLLVAADVAFDRTENPQM